MVICNYFMQGRCRYGDRCWNEHPRGGGRQEQSRYHYQQPPAGSRTWTSSNQRYVQPSNFSKSTTWSRDNSQTSYAQHSDSHDNRSRHYNSGSSAGSFSTQNQNRFSTLPSQDHSRDTQSDKDGSLFEDIKRDLDAWESSGQWIFSVYCVSKDTSNATGFADISPEELRLECYTARDSGNMQNYVNSVQHLATQWKQRIHAIKNTNISSQTALISELTKPAVSSVPTFGGQQSSSFPTTSSSASSPPQSASSFSFKPDSQAPSAGPISSFSPSSGFASKPATGFAVTGSAASFTFPVTAASDGASSGFNNAKAVSASTFSFAPTTSSGAGTSAFSGFGAATTALPASASSPATGAFGGTTAPSGFGQSTTSGFGGTTAASGFGQSTTSGFGGTTAASGFGQSTTSGFGGTTAASGFGQSTTSGFGGTTAASGFGQSTTSGFGGTTAASGFGQSDTSVFGGGPSTSGFGGLVANTVTSGFGAKTSAVSDLFKTGAASSATTSIFASGVSVSRPPSVSSTSEASSKNPVFTPRSELSDKELLQFESKKFSLGNIPLRPPSEDLVRAAG